MKLPSSSLTFILLSVFACPILRVHAQTIAEALDTPGLPWAPSGTVTPLNNPFLSHDGVDVLRIDATTSASPSSWPSVATPLTVVSVVEFWHRSQDYAATTRLGRDSAAVAVSSYWKKERWLQWPAALPVTGPLTISNLGAKGSGPLYVDEVTVTQAAQVSLAEALDMPGFTGAANPAGMVIGLRESWLAPDGVDAVAFASQDQGLDANFAAAGVISFRSTGGDVSPAVFARTPAGGFLPAFSNGDRSWTLLPAPGKYQFIVASSSGSLPTYRSQIPVVMDSLEVLPSIPINEALDAPGLSFTVTGLASGISAPPGYPDGDFLLCTVPVEGTDRTTTVSLAVTGPGIVRFAALGDLSVARAGESGSTSYTSTDWQTREVPVYYAGETVNWTTRGNGFLLNEVSFTAGANPSVADLLNYPGLIPEILVPAWLGATTGKNIGDPALMVSPITPVPQQAVLRLPFSGPSLVSINVNTGVLLRIDGGGWQTPVSNFVPFLALAPGVGSHTLEVTRPAVLDHLEVIPLVQVPLAEALDAPGMSFTTSPDFPWTGYQLPASTGRTGNHAALAGSYPTAGDPCVETQVTGPGILKSQCPIHAFGVNTPDNLTNYPKLFVDGVLADPYFVPAEILVPAGLHAIRWVQKGSQIQNGSGSLALLDAVSFTPLPPLSYSAALETPGRTWTVGGTGEVTAVAWPWFSPDGVDSVIMKGIPDAAYLETTAQLPCTVSLRGRNVQVSLAGGSALFQINSNTPSAANLQGYTSNRSSVSGIGPAKIRFTATSAQSVLDSVAFEETGDKLLPEVNLGTPGIAWKLYGGQA